MTTQREQVIAVMKNGGPKLPSALADATGVPKGNVYAVLSDLKAEGKVSGDGKIGYSLAGAAAADAQAGVTLDAAAVCKALLCDDPNWTPMPRPLLEEVSSVRGERMTLALQELLVKRAIKYTSQGYMIDVVAAADAVIGKELLPPVEVYRKVVEPPTYSHEEPSKVVVTVPVRKHEEPLKVAEPPKSVATDLNKQRHPLHFSLRDDGVLSFYAGSTLQLELPAVDTKRLRKFLACFTEEAE